MRLKHADLKGSEDVLVQQPIIIRDEYFKHPILGTQEGYVIVGFGSDVGFGLAERDLEDLESWLHEFDEWTISEILLDHEVYFNPYLYGWNVYFIKCCVNGMILESSIDHLLSSLVFPSEVPTLDGWSVISPDDFWWCLINTKRD